MADKAHSQYGAPVVPRDSHALIAPGTDALLPSCYAVLFCCFRSCTFCLPILLICSDFDDLVIFLCFLCFYHFQVGYVIKWFLFFGLFWCDARSVLGVLFWNWPGSLHCSCVWLPCLTQSALCNLSRCIISGPERRAASGTLLKRAAVNLVESQASSRIATISCSGRLAVRTQRSHADLQTPGPVGDPQRGYCVFLLHFHESMKSSWLCIVTVHACCL